MADDVQVQFGAKIDQLLDGVKNVKDAIAGVTDSVKAQTGESAKHADAMTGHFSQIRFAIQGLTNPIRGIRDNLGELAEAFLAGFAIEKVAEFVKEMADAGLQAQRMSLMLGTSVEYVDTLGGVAKVTGTSLEGLALGLERISLNVQRSTSDAFSPQAAALKVLGLSAKELIGIPTDQYFEKLTAAVSKFNPSLNLTNALQQIGGRGFAQMIPALMLGAEGYKALEEQVHRASAGFADAVPGMTQTHTNLSMLAISSESLSAVIFTTLKPAFDGIILTLTQMVQSMRDSVLEGGLFGKALDALAFAGKLVASAFAAIVATLRGMGEAIDAVFKLAMGDIANFEAYAKGASDNFEKIGRDLRNTLTAIWAPAITISPKGGLDAAAITENARKAVEASQTRIEAEIAMLKGELAQKKVIYDADAAQWKITDDRKFAMTMQATQQEVAAERDKLLQMQALWPAHTKEWEMVQKKLVTLQQQSATEMLRLNAASIASMQQKWTEMLSGLQSAFNGQLKGLLQGTTTWSQAWRAIMLDMTVFFIEQVEKMAVKWAAAKLAELTATQATEAGKVAAQASGEAATLPIQVGKFLSDITADAALTFAGIFANLAPILGPAAAGPAAAGQATVLAQLANVPKFETGTDYVPFTGLAMVHKGERITPASENKGGGNTQVSIAVSAWDGASVHSWLRSGGADAIAAAVARAWNQSPSLRPGY